METKYTTRIKIIRCHTKPELQKNVNIYLSQLKGLHAKLVGQPKMQMIHVNIKKLETYVRRAEINNYNLHSKLKISLDTSIHDLQQEQLVDLAQHIRQDYTHIVPIIYYEQICYTMLTKVYKSNIAMLN